MPTSKEGLIVFVLLHYGPHLHASVSSGLYVTNVSQQTCIIIELNHSEIIVLQLVCTQ